MKQLILEVQSLCFDIGNSIKYNCRYYYFSENKKIRIVITDYNNKELIKLIIFSDKTEQLNIKILKNTIYKLKKYL